MKKNRNGKRRKRSVIKNDATVSYIYKDCINVLQVPVGKMPPGKAEMYMQKFAEAMTPMTDGYNIIYMAKSDS